MADTPKRKVGRPPKSKSNTKGAKEVKKEVKKEEKEKKICSCCGTLKDAEKDYYMSYSIVNKFSKRMSICKECTWELYNTFYKESNGDEEVAVYRLCRLLDDVYLEKLFESAVDEATNASKNIYQVYKTKISSLKQYATYTFENGDILNTTNVDERKVIKIEKGLTDRDRQNEQDVLNMLGYDPFDTENLQDRKYLFNRMVDMLDDSVIEDNILLMSIIEIIKSFCQMDKLNKMIADLTNDEAKINGNNGSIKALIDTKSNLMKSILKIAEDNGLSAKFNVNKSKGSGTLTGILKKLQDIGFEDAKINLYDILTSQSMKQIADISHKSIMEQLMLNESDYTDMIAQQKDMLYNMDNELMDMREENRKLKILLKSKGVDYTEFNVVDVDVDNNNFGVINDNIIEKDYKIEEE